MKGRIVLALVTLSILAATFAASSFGLTSALVVRSSATALDLHDKSQKLKLQAKDPIHVDIRSVTMTAGEVIGWHGHAGPSILVVKAGTLTVSQADGRACSVAEYDVGDAFVHAEDAHAFQAGSSGAEFTIVYLLPENALPAPITVPTPTECS